MSGSGNPYDPINRILRITRPLGELLRKIDLESEWLDQHRSEANESPPSEQMREYDTAHAKWQDLMNLARQNQENRRQLVDLIKDGRGAKDRLSPETNQKIENYLKLNDLDFYEEALYVIIERSIRRGKISIQRFSVGENIFMRWSMPNPIRRERSRSNQPIKTRNYTPNLRGEWTRWAR